MILLKNNKVILKFVIKLLYKVYTCKVDGISMLQSPVEKIVFVRE